MKPKQPYRIAAGEREQTPQGHRGRHRPQGNTARQHREVSPMNNTTAAAFSLEDFAQYGYINASRRFVVTTDIDPAAREALSREVWQRLEYIELRHAGRSDYLWGDDIQTIIEGDAEGVYSIESEGWADAQADAAEAEVARATEDALQALTGDTIGFYDFAYNAKNLLGDDFAEFTSDIMCGDPSQPLRDVIKYNHSGQVVPVLIPDGRDSEGNPRYLCAEFDLLDLYESVCGPERITITGAQHFVHDGDGIGTLTPGELGPREVSRQDFRSPATVCRYFDESYGLEHITAATLAA